MNIILKSEDVNIADFGKKKIIYSDLIFKPAFIHSFTFTGLIYVFICPERRKKMTTDSVDLFTLKTNTSKAKFTQENQISDYL